MMNRKLGLIGLMVLILAGTAPLMADTGSGTLYGNAAAKADSNLTIEDMLLYAIQDEYFARAEYVAIMEKFGAMRPFSNIKDAETTHISWITQAYSAYKLSVPADDAKQHVVVPATLKTAFEAGVQAELDNIAMYDKFLATPLMQDARYVDLKALFTNLKNASYNHLKAFQTQLSKY